MALRHRIPGRGRARAPSGAPWWPGEAWPTSTAETEDVDAAALNSLIADMDAGRFGLFDQLLLIRNGRVVVDCHWDHSARYAELDLTTWDRSLRERMRTS